MDHEYRSAHLNFAHTIAREVQVPAAEEQVPADRDRKAKGQPAPSVSVVIPAMNESENIGWVLGSMPRWIDEVILVDGQSTDGTVEVAANSWPDLLVVNQRTKGKGAALREGFYSAHGDIVVMIDADGSMDPGEIDRYVEPLASGACDVVKGSRWLDGGGSHDITPVRKLGNRALLGLVNTLFRSSFTELCYGYMAFRRSCLTCLQLSATGFEIETQIVVNALRAGLRVQEVPSMEASRRSGESNLHPARDGLRIIRTVGAALVREPGGLPQGVASPPEPGGEAPARETVGGSGSTVVSGLSQSDEESHSDLSGIEVGR